MKISLIRGVEAREEGLVLGMFEDEKDFTNSYARYDQNLVKELTLAEKSKQFLGKFLEAYCTKFGDYKIVLILGMGKRKEMNLERLRRLCGKAVRQVKASGVKGFQSNIMEMAAPGFNEEKVGMATAEGLILGNYDFIKYLSEEKSDKRKELSSVSLIWTRGEAKVGEGIKEGEIVAKATNFVRNMVNEPANVMNSLQMEKVAKDLVKSSSKMKIKVLGEQEMEKLGMGALLGVNKGSANPPRLVIIEYNNGHDKPIALVGKGITFDSGGYNLKPTKSIEEMKGDMSGAAAVLGTIKAAAELGLKKNIIGVMPLCENMVSGEAQRPGDIVRAYNGKTIEIGNTDAEGRLILADALAYVDDKYKPEVIIDIATLTGSCVVALGYYAMGMISKEEILMTDLKRAGEASGDRVWQLPFFEEYQNWMEGTITDLNNINMKGKGYEAGTITAGVFLSNFVAKAKWAHLDIAGTAYWGVDGEYLQKGGTGSGVRLLSYYLIAK
jgi:leucyl aminopeptidase